MYYCSTLTTVLHSTIRGSIGTHFMQYTAMMCVISTHHSPLFNDVNACIQKYYSLLTKHNINVTVQSICLVAMIDKIACGESVAAIVAGSTDGAYKSTYNCT